MGKRKFLVTTAILVALASGVNVYAANSLTQMDLKRNSSTDSVDVTFYLTGESANTVVSRKANDRYVVLLPNVSSSSDVAPALGGVKDLITNIEVKNVDDGIGGYTKVTFSTTKPVNIKTYTKKASPLTQAQKDSKAIIAQNNTKPAASAQPKTQAAKTEAKPAVNTSTTKQNTPAQTKPAAAQTKPASTQTKPAAAQTKPAAAQTKNQDTNKQSAPKTVSVPKLVPVDVSKALTKPVKQEAQKPVQPKVQPAEPKQQIPQVQREAAPADDYVPKMKFDKDGKRIIDLEPRISHNTDSAQPEEPVIAEDKNVIGDTDNNPAPVQEEIPDGKKYDFPMWILIAGGSVLGICVAYLIFDAITHKNKKDESRLESFYQLSERNKARRRRREYYDIVNNDELNWQEKYKLYTEKEKQKEQIGDTVAEDMSYVADTEGKGNVVLPIREEKSAEVEKIEKLNEEVLRKNLQAKISQMEHALSQTPSMREPEEPDNRVKSADDAIMKNVSDIKLKSFSKQVSLGQTLRSGIDGLSGKKSTQNAEGKFVKLRESALSVVKRRSASTNAKIIGLQEKYINGEMDMYAKNNYENSSVEEYLSLLDRSEAESSYSKSGMTNTISRSAGVMPQISGGMIVKSGYNIDSERGIYLVDMDGVSAIVGKIKDNIVMLKKFNTRLDKQLQVRLNNDNVYIVRVGNYKCLVDVTGDKIGTLIEI